MRGTIIRRIRQGVGKLLRDQRGNAFMLTAAAVVPLIGIVGSAVDIGRAYMTQLRLQQACDAGVLAGRRSMAAGSYDADAEAEANKMFNFNFPAGIYGSSGIGFDSEANGKSNVVGEAHATLPTALMYIFGKDAFNLTANCAAKLEISNVDVMMVLDVTGSMASKAKNKDKLTKIQALRAAAKDFFETLAGADIGDGQLRFGVVPYSATVNVGSILYDADRSWLSENLTIPSRRWGEGQQEVCENEGSWWNPNWVCRMETVNLYHYEDRTFAIGSVKPGNKVTVNTGTSGGNVKATWAGCIIERQTQPFGSDEDAPDDAYDMDIDMVPTSDDATKWNLYIPAITYNRRQVAPLVTSDNRSSLSGAACPHAAMKLKKVVDSAAFDSTTEIDQDKFDDYIDDLEPVGSTYHDVGMAWGARLISPTGLFASENVDAQGKPIDRHIVFMTDGKLEPSLGGLSHQGVEESLPRIGATGYDDAVARHYNRFLQLCARAREKGITIWVVSFGSGSNDDAANVANLGKCATSGKALAAADADQLNEQFQAIARQISRLRLSQ